MGWSVCASWCDIFIRHLKLNLTNGYVLRNVAHTFCSDAHINFQHRRERAPNRKKWSEREITIGYNEWGLELNGFEEWKLCNITNCQLIVQWCSSFCLHFDFRTTWKLWLRHGSKKSRIQNTEFSHINWTCFGNLLTTYASIVFHHFLSLSSSFSVN